MLVGPFIGKHVKKSFARGVCYSLKKNRLIPQSFSQIQAVQIGTKVLDPPHDWLVRWSNHQCADTNASLEKSIIGGRILHCLYLTKAVAPGAEIVWDYGCELEEGQRPEACLCGHPRCRGWILSEEAAQKVLPSLEDFCHCLGFFIVSSHCANTRHSKNP